MKSDSVPVPAPHVPKALSPLLFTAPALPQRRNKFIRPPTVAQWAGEILAVVAVVVKPGKLR